MSLLKTSIRENANLEANLDASKTPPSTAFLLQETSLRPESFQPKSEKSWRSLLPFLTLSVKIRHLAKEKKQPIGVVVGKNRVKWWLNFNGFHKFHSKTVQLPYRIRRVSIFTQASPNTVIMLTCQWTNSQVFSKLKKKHGIKTTLRQATLGMRPCF